MEIFKGVVKYEAEINLPVFFTPFICCLYVSQNVPPYALKFFWNEFPNERLREVHTAEAHTGKESLSYGVLFHFQQIVNTEQREPNERWGGKKKGSNHKLRIWLICFPNREIIL